ncbi:hypothetical protein EQH57_0473 [Dictyocoela roeselum]|nr:hypothetical protein EQH57_0473 [Dictyocoela roeselum]
MDINNLNVLKFVPHYHPEETERLIKLKINETIKNALEDKNSKLIDVIHKSLNLLSEDEKNNLPNLKNLNDYFIRRKRLSGINKQTDEILYIYKYTHDNKIFLQYDSNNDKNRILIWISNHQKIILENTNYWLCDATFDTTTKNFSQLLILHGLYFNKTIPCAFILMMKKSTDSYNEVFSFIKRHISNKPEYISIDFELQLFNTISNIYPSTKIFGCLFHFSQILIRDLRGPLLERYKTDAAFKKFVKFHYFLAFVPLSHLKTELKKLKSLINEVDIYEKFHVYFKEKFIENLKKLKIWSQNFGLQILE